MRGAYEVGDVVENHAGKVRVVTRVVGAYRVEYEDGGTGHRAEVFSFTLYRWGAYRPPAPKVTPEDLWSALLLGGGEPPEADGTNDEAIAEWNRLYGLCVAARPRSGAPRQRPLRVGGVSSSAISNSPGRRLDAGRYLREN